MISKSYLDFNNRDFIYSISGINSRNIIVEYFDYFYSNTYYTLDGRTSLLLGLKSLNLPPGSAVAVPLYCCKSVFDTILEAGLKIYFVDVRNDFCIDINSLEKINDKISAVIIIHMFGKIVDVDKVREVVGNKIIIEDCAHSVISFKSSNHSRKPILGTKGDLAFYSFRLGKYVSSGTGGLLAVNNVKLVDSVKKNYTLMKSLNPYKILFYLLTFITKSKIYSNYSLYNLFIIEMPKKFSFSKSYKNSGNFKMPHSFRKLLSFKLKAYSNNVKKQRKNASKILNNFRPKNFEFYLDKSLKNNLALFIPIKFKDTISRDFSYNFLLDNKIALMNYFPEKDISLYSDQAFFSQCPNSIVLGNSVLLLSVHYNLSKNKIENIIEILSKLDYSLGQSNMQRGDKDGFNIGN